MGEKTPSADDIDGANVYTIHQEADGLLLRSTCAAAPDFLSPRQSGSSGLRWED